MIGGGYSSNSHTTLNENEEQDLRINPIADPRRNEALFEYHSIGCHPARGGAKAGSLDAACRRAYGGLHFFFFFSKMGAPFSLNS